MRLTRQLNSKIIRTKLVIERERGETRAFYLGLIGAYGNLLVQVAGEI